MLQSPQRRAKSRMITVQTRTCLRTHRMYTYPKLFSSPTLRRYYCQAFVITFLLQRDDSLFQLSLICRKYCSNIYRYLFISVSALIQRSNVLAWAFRVLSFTFSFMGIELEKPPSMVLYCNYVTFRESVMQRDCLKFYLDD